jgi:hypothetical protein
VRMGRDAHGFHMSRFGVVQQFLLGIFKTC